MNHQELINWQQCFRAQPKIWYVMVPCDGSREETGNYYETKTGAQLEADWRIARKQRATVHCVEIHSDVLSFERWGRKTPNPAPKPV